MGKINSKDCLLIEGSKGFYKITNIESRFSKFEKLLSGGNRWKFLRHQNYKILQCFPIERVSLASLYVWSVCELST